MKERPIKAWFMGTGTSQTVVEWAMGTLALLALIFLLLWPAFAADLECRTGDVEWQNGRSPILHDHDEETRNGIYWGINGTFLWYQFSEDSPQNPESDAQSVELAVGVTGVSVCSDGTVSLSQSALEIANKDSQYCPATGPYNDCETTTTTTTGETTTSSTTTTTEGSTTTSTAEVSSTTVTSIQPTTTVSTNPSTTVTSSTPTTTLPAPTTTALTELPFTDTLDVGLWISGALILIGLGAILILLVERAKGKGQ